MLSGERALVVIQFDINFLRRRVKIHDLAAKGFDTFEIGQKVGMHRQNVLRYLKKPRPILHKPVSPWWTDSARCLGMDIERFYPTANGPKAVALKQEAMKVCADCPVRQRCYDTAVANYEQHGIWGGEDFSQFRYQYDDRTGVVTAKFKRGGRRGQVAKVG